MHCVDSQNYQYMSLGIVNSYHKSSIRVLFMNITSLDIVKIEESFENNPDARSIKIGRYHLLLLHFLENCVIHKIKVMSRGP